MSDAKADQASSDSSSSLEEPVRQATERLAVAERELTRAIEAISVPHPDADNAFVGERVRIALAELASARQALERVLEAVR